MFSIIVAFPKIEDAVGIKKILMQSGYNVDLVCNLGSQVVSRTNELDGGVVITGYKLSDMSYYDLDNYLPKGFSTLLIVGSQRLGECAGSGIRCLGTPLRRTELLNALDDFYRDYERYRKKKKSQPRQRTEEEKQLILKAKELLMDKKGITEEEAHRYIQKTSMDLGLSFVEVADTLLKGVGNG